MGGKTINQTFGTATTRAGFKAVDIKEKLNLSQKRLNGVYVENESWEKCFNRYDREHTFFYADPPYWQAIRYGNTFEWQEYELLAKMMSECKGKVMLSINNHPDIVELFKDFRIEHLQSDELVICNY